MSFNQNEIIEIETFLQEISDISGPVLLNFTAKWCIPCQEIEPQLQKFLEGKQNLRMIHIDIDLNNEITQTYEIKGIPCLLLLKKGQEINSFLIIDEKGGSGLKMKVNLMLI